MPHSNSAILATLAYSDIFDYPLTKAQIWRYLLAKDKMPYTLFEKKLYETLSIKEKDGFFYLSGRGKLVGIRKDREKLSTKKLKKVRKIINLLRFIPTVMYIGISGSLAMQNADKDADIDIFIIARKNTLWITRFFILIFLEIFHVRRKRGHQKSKDSICVNMLIDTAHMALPKSRHTLYQAHEVMQMKPYFSRDFTYETFLSHNSWVAKFLPNSFPTTVVGKLKKRKITNNSLLRFLDTPAKIAQQFYMRNYISTEVIRDGFVAFHPKDYSEYVMKAWEERKKKYDIQI